MNDVFAKYDVSSKNGSHACMAAVATANIYYEMHKNPFVAIYISNGHIIP